MTTPQLPADIAAICKKKFKDEIALTFEEADKLTKYLLTRKTAEEAYAVSYAAATKAQRLSMRNETNVLLRTAADKAEARQAARDAFILDMASIFIKAAATALLARVEKI